MWIEAGFRLASDDDPGLARFAARNPGLFLVATSTDQIVASAMGAWDGRRGWIYHLTTSASHRRNGIASLVITRFEAELRDLSAVQVNVVVRQGNNAGREFWLAAGYDAVPSRQFGKDLT